ncbi:hypothetical protein Val02_41720 [Virgisporangium aliadipatigenens]|uniref:Uncharacterized protein n=1 Tax=Virgisporangium aliadipatigenens TaxID=741659 RepID=A0A8J3YNZ2_9ACTN|nr:hypothetical protein [Virgisporangium aliadipatigenens]GIJ47286.1 hypothetical protein Val02_41720 [Virgisporangium aliadipatigenens]
MEPLDFPHRLLTAATDAGAAAPDASMFRRHLPILRRCVPDADEPLLLARVDRPGDRGSYVLLLTAERLVVTAESRVLRRLRLHLNSACRDLIDVLWTPEPAMGGVAFSATTAFDGVREHFWVRSDDADTTANVLSGVFRRVLVPA